MQSQFPGQQFTAMVTRAWHEEVGPAPLSYVVGEFWSAGNVIFFSSEHPRLFEKGDPTHSPRVDPADIRRRGAVILFDPQARLNKQPTPETSAPWLAEFPGAQARPPFRHPAANAARRDHLGDRLGLAETAGRGCKCGTLS